MPKRSGKRPRDLNRFAASIVDEATTDANEESLSEPDASEIRSYAQALGRRGGLKGGKVRAERLTPERRSEIARKAAQARWSSRED